jgi:hypothetical protein
MTSFSGSLRRCVAVALFAAPIVPVAHAQSSSVAIPIGLEIGLPQGEFAENVNVAGGFAGGILWRIAPEFGIRAGLDFMIYGADTRRVPLGGGVLGLINVDVTTTNAIVGGGIGAQLGMPGPRPRPYLGGTIGFSAFTTSSSVSGSNSEDTPFASTNNSNDGTFAKSAFAGLYIPVARGTTMIDIGVRHVWNGEEVRYLTPGDITEDVDGNIVLTPRQSRADMLVIRLGVTITPGRARSASSRTRPLAD